LALCGVDVVSSAYGDGIVPSPHGAEQAMDRPISDRLSCSEQSGKTDDAQAAGDQIDADFTASLDMLNEGCPNANGD
jgi:hypothetical protein